MKGKKTDLRKGVKLKLWLPARFQKRVEKCAKSSVSVENGNVHKKKYEIIYSGNDWSNVREKKSRGREKWGASLEITRSYLWRIIVYSF